MTTHLSGTVFAAAFVGAMGMGIPAGGTHYYVKPYSGLDGNDGLTPDSALNTVEAAYDKCTEYKNDVVHLVAEHITGAYTTDYLATTLTWAKSMTHLVGEACPSMFSQRSRIAWDGTNYDGTATPMIDLTASSCIFQNIQFWGGVADAQALCCLKNSGQRNVFRNCHIAGIGSDTQDATGANSLWFYDSSENYFENCVIGTNTVKRGTAAVYEISFTTAAGVGSGNNVFRNCLITGWCESAGNYLFLSAPANNSLGRILLFDNCLFYNPGTILTGGATMTQAFSIGANANGHVILHNTTIFGAGNVNASDTGLVLCGAGSIPNNAEVTDLGLALVTTNA